MQLACQQVLTVVQDLVRAGQPGIKVTGIMLLVLAYQVQHHNNVGRNKMALQDNRRLARAIGSPGKLGGGLQSRLGSGLNNRNSSLNNSTFGNTGGLGQNDTTAENDNQGFASYSPSNGLQDIAQDTLSRGAGALRSISPSTEIGQPDSNLIEQRMHGGPMKGKQTYLVGEKGVEAKVDKNGSKAVGTNGPELIQPTDDGVIIPNHVLAKLDEQTLNALGIAPRVNGGLIERAGTFLGEQAAQRRLEEPRSMGDFAQPIDNAVEQQGTKFSMGDFGTPAPSTSRKAGGRLPAQSNNTSLLHPNAIALQRQLASGKQIPSDTTPIQSKITGDQEKFKYNAKFKNDKDYDAFLRQQMTERNLFTPGSNQPSTARTDPGLLAQFNNQQPTGQNQLGAYSPAGIQEAADYRQARDSGQNQTRFDPTNFDASGQDVYNAQGLNTSGTIQGALPWEGDVRGLNREQISQFQQQNLIGPEGAQDLRKSDIAQQRLGLDKQVLDFQQQQAQRPVQNEYGLSDGEYYPKSGPATQQYAKTQQQRQSRSLNALKILQDVDSYPKPAVDAATAWLQLNPVDQGF